MLHVERLGTAGAERLVLLHGFTQTGRSWLDLAQQLADRFEVLLIDAPGHAGSATIECGLWEAADLIVEEGGPAVYVGYSMGARLALHAALAHPEAVQRLVLVGGTAGISSDDERVQRRRDDEQLAQRLERDGLERFLDHWLANPLFAGLPPERAQRADRLRNSVPGLASSLRRCGTGMQDDLWPRLGELEMPVFLMAGEHDHKFAGIAERMQTMIGSNALVHLVRDAGHTAHLEQPDEFLRAVRQWLSEAPGRR